MVESVYAAVSSVDELTHQVQDTVRVALVLGVLGEVKEALAGLAGPGSSGVGDLGLLATEVVAEVLGGNWLIAKPEVLLRESKLPVEP